MRRKGRQPHFAAVVPQAQPSRARWWCTFFMCDISQMIYFLVVFALCMTAHMFVSPKFFSGGGHMLAGVARTSDMIIEALPFALLCFRRRRRCLLLCFASAAAAAAAAFCFASAAAAAAFCFALLPPWLLGSLSHNTRRTTVVVYNTSTVKVYTVP